MSEWTKQRLEQMIADGVEESLSLDYKGAGSLSKTDERRKAEVTKDVSSFANASGGVLIYGIAEFEDDQHKHLPERLDPIKRQDITKEWLDQIVHTIQPRIEGIIIHPVTISERDNTVCYVVEVPQSSTAHMARDHRYHKRHNFTTAQMEDYEVRDVMNRRKHPKVEGYIRVNRHTSDVEPEGAVLVRLVNVSEIMAKHVMVRVELPVDMGGDIAVEEPVARNNTPDGTCELFQMTHKPGHPLFPSSEIILRRRFWTRVKNRGKEGKPLQSTQEVKVTIYADEMPPIRATLDPATVLQGFVYVQGDKTK